MVDSFQNRKAENTKYLNVEEIRQFGFLQPLIGMGFHLNYILQFQRHQKFIGVGNGREEVSSVYFRIEMTKLCK